ncbi:MAG: hypothetical protein DRP96_05525 [Candidatus Neomarinimicrobiota bacterium]|nr:MAG: hypothetical protein DRP96_05525 [Candidatus Neomarinimicrobiota bacterium]
MTDKFNVRKKKTSKQPYDSKIDEKCQKCSGDIVYRNSSYFSHKVYYKICNGCGWYQLLDPQEWRQTIAREKTADNNSDDQVISS